jgi:hypothetical protein
VLKVVGAIEFSNLVHDICRVKIRKKWWVYLHRFGSAVYFAISAKTHSNFKNWQIFSKTGGIFENNQYRRSQVAGCAVFSIVRSSKCTTQSSLIKGTVSQDFRLLVFFMNQFTPNI